MMEPAVLMRRLIDEGVALRECVRAGLIGPMPLSAAAATVTSMAKFGMIGGALSASAARGPDRIAVIDELGTLTYAELDGDTNAIAHRWRAEGLRAGASVAIMARNHRGFLMALFAAGKCGARIVLLNHDFAGPQLREVAEREGVDLLVYDEEYAAAVREVSAAHGKWRAWADTPGDDTLAAAAADPIRGPLPRPAVQAKLVVLTSGTTGTPKGAPRPDPRSLTPMGGLFGKVPYRSGEVIEICPPLFHALGLNQAVLAIAMGMTVVIRRRFDPLVTLASIARHRVTTLILVPVMLQRMLDAEPNPRERHDLSALRIIFLAGSQLGAPLCTRALDAFGPVLYNLYGSTECFYATLATPDELTAEPGCVGTAVRGVRLEILGPDDQPVPTGVTGRIFIANQLQFEGYTGGATKQRVRGLMSSGDVGHVDATGRLFIDGRDDDMIVSGGENVFPGEVEETLAAHPGIEEVAVLGVADPEFGHRLKAFVVARAGAQLTEDDVKSYVRATLARFKVPREVVFLDELPRNPTGKVLKRQLS
ncbi:acyl-CoA synthetase [Skermania sp. ID1734]|uniref:acyl-CoA synthetase n=1 Tax=Skermania sp. ID1734 TaxID=2597516 RepID=UPI00117BF6F4|nr:acyl-CoA synthetase [Skermania sp. ID1734]TSD95994.1 acyl-CoA synthetase [Skermania sp. ID1734]